LRLALAAEDPRIRRDRLDDPGVAADHRTRSDHGVAAQDVRSRVERDAVANGRVTLVAARTFGRAQALHAERSQRDTLVDLHVVADLGGLADHHARAMVDEETFADASAGVD